MGEKTEIDAREKLSLQRISRLKIVLVLTSSYLAAEVIGGLLTGSLALIADAGHMLTDAAGLGLALFAINFSRRPATPQRTYGFYRTEILASLTNSVILILISAYIIYEAYRRILEPPEIQSFSMTIVAAIGLAVNLIGMQLMKKGFTAGEPESLNMRGAYLEVLSDTLGSVGVIAAGVIMFATKFYLADPIISIGLALFMLPRTWSLMRKSINILMEGAPSNVSYEEVKKAISQVGNVIGIFDLHIWTVTSGMDAMSAHVVISDPSRSGTILQEITSILERDFKITHATIQIESYHSEREF